MDPKDLQESTTHITDSSCLFCDATVPCLLDFPVRRCAPCILLLSQVGGEVRPCVKRFGDFGAGRPRGVEQSCLARWAVGFRSGIAQQDAAFWMQLRETLTFLFVASWRFILLQVKIHAKSVIMARNMSSRLRKLTALSPASMW